MTSRLLSSRHSLVISLVALMLLFLLSVAPARAALTDLLPKPAGATESGEAQPDSEEATATDGASQSTTAETREPGEASDQPPPPEPSPNPVKPDLQTEVGPPVKTPLPESGDADTRQQIQMLRDSLDERQAALESSRHNLTHAESLLERLNLEYQSFELRLEKAGLNLTDEYAQLLKQRLARIRNQTTYTRLTEVISKQLAAAREEQLRLEEYGAMFAPDAPGGDEMSDRRADLVSQLHTLVTKHIKVLDQYYTTVIELQERFSDYQELLQKRLFWLPSTEPVNIDMFRNLYQGVSWFLSELRWTPLLEAVKQSVAERGLRILLVVTLLIILLARVRSLKQALNRSGEHVGNVGRDRGYHTLSAATFTFLLALPGVLALSAAALLIKEGNEFYSSLSDGIIRAAFATLLLRFLHSVARAKGLGERHFHWNSDTLRAIRRNIPQLLLILVPVTILMAPLETRAGSDFSDSWGRLLLVIASMALALFAHRVMRSVRLHYPDHSLFRIVHIAAVATPLLLAVASLWGFHYTAMELERLLFISLSWLAFVMLLYYMSLRVLAVRERRLTLERLRERRAAERRLAETREAAESSGEGVPLALEMPEMNLKDISQQSKALLKILSVILAAAVLWVLWADVIPALQVFDDMTLWTIGSGTEGEAPTPITLGDLMLALLFGAGTVLAARNLPGTLEVMVLSRLKLEPGAGYAITTLATYLIVFIGIATALMVIGLQWSKLQWLVAALGVGLGFGLQEIVANFVSGIILLFERPIRVGDTVSIAGTTGTVSRIRIRATTLVDWDRKEQIIPNKTFVTQDLTNWTLSDPITRVIIRVGVAYGSDVDKVRDLLHEVTLNNERVVEDPAPAVFCVGFGDSSVDFEVRAFVPDLLDFMPLSHELHAAITQALNEAGIEIPFPQRDIHIRTTSSPWPPARDGDAPQ